MKSLAQIEQRIFELRQAGRAEPRAAAEELLSLGEEILIHWLAARDEQPTEEEREGFRLLALHRQGVKGDPSFNSCRESCRELVYYHNLIQAADAGENCNRYLGAACSVAMHLCLFIGGKLQDPELGDFCCASRPAQTQAAANA